MNTKAHDMYVREAETSPSCLNLKHEYCPQSYQRVYEIHEIKKAGNVDRENNGRQNCEKSWLSKLNVMGIM